MNKTNVGDVVLFCVNVASVAYAAAREWHVVSMSLPAGMEIFAVVALGVLSGALVGWELYYLMGARSKPQKAIALLMFFAQTLASIALVLGDTWSIQDPANAPVFIGTAVLWGVPIMLGLNIIALFLVHAYNPAQAIRDANRELEDELQRQAAANVKDNSATLARHVAGARAAQLAQQAIDQFRGAGDVDGDGDFDMEDIKALFGKKNGHKPATHTMAKDVPAPVKAVRRRKGPAARQESED